MFKNNYIQKFCIYSIIILSVAASFLFSPRPDASDDSCAKYVALSAHAGFMLNCDAANYCTTAAHPADLFDSASTRQSRPLYILAGTIIGYPVQSVLNQFKIPLFHKLGDEGATYVGYYIGYVFINFLLLLFSLYLFELILRKVTSNDINTGLIYAFCIFLVSNIVTKAFFWTAHQQFFSLFTPLLTIYLFLRIGEKKHALKNIGGLSFACGVLMLLYGNFVPLFVCLQIAAYRVDRKFNVPALARNGLLFLLPTATWILICIYENGHYYNHEVVRYRQLVWIADALKISFAHFLDVFGGFALSYLQKFATLSFFILAAIVCSTIPKFPKDFKHNILYPLHFIFAVFFLFFLILGYYSPRLTYTLFPILLCVIALGVNNLPALRDKPVLFYMAAIGWHLYNVLSYGPFA